ncbi:hypothetical protein E4L96_20925 [Massilia arenosa]|uniref:DUF4062 domain-containing protein n=1 Tax=Zemynaea arenosa TaxID=2561931 RepID=A0A4Y9RQZ2_9BURK|nr:hypothetical protein [Massilia arenosa]TFW11520.1 hypothetical protein E4L96_20925 [Massilia arenosa]
MAGSIKSYQLLVASPSDVGEERRVVEDVVSQLNSQWSRSLGLRIDTVKWENSTHPEFGEYPQAVINEQIGDDFDILVGIFWTRIGSPTPQARSGTVEEIERALKRRKDTGGVPEVMLYFKTAQISPKVDISQLAAVQQFQASIGDLGGLYFEFESLSDFESSLRAHLAAVAQKLAARRSADRAGLNSVEHPLSPDRGSEEDDDELGYFDYIDIHQSQIEVMNASMTAISRATVLIGEQIEGQSVEMGANGKHDVRIARTIVNRTAQYMNNYADTLSGQVRVLGNARVQAFDSLSKLLTFAGTGENSPEDLTVLRKTLRETINSAESAREGMQGMRDAAAGLPRMSKELNASKRRVVAELDSLLSEIDSVRSTVRNIVEAIDRLLTSS